MTPRFEPDKIEPQVQKTWARHDSFAVSEDPAREKFYCLCMFPYPSGSLHMGHVRNYTIGDVLSRYQRMRGRNVLQPMGWDAFGMPAENAAIKNNVPPARWTYANIDEMRSQLQRFGFAYDWTREVTTCRPEYYRWEQWLFTRLYEKDLVYQKTAPVNWCPVDQTVLANEQVENGCCWRCGTVVERRELRQWFMRITRYADELLDDLDKLDGWPDAVRTMQRNWIGRSEGLEISFEIDGHPSQTVYTTRPDTLMGVTYLAVAARHPLARAAAKSNPKIAEFVAQCNRLQASEAAQETVEKRGIDLGLRARHPVTGAALPVLAANFVLMEYGTGAVMAVPGHDQRDWEFARKYDLPVTQVIAPADSGEIDLDECAYVEHGVLVNSGDYDGMNFDEAFDALAMRFEKAGTGRRCVNYRLRDWGVSRQRYWGAPIPMIDCAACGIVPVPEQDLPVVLPEDVVIEGVGSPLKSRAEFYQVDCPRCGKQAKRETDTFDTFMESSWYFARYACPDQDEAMIDQRSEYWLPVDQYIGGIEHAILHLLYARFYTKLMRDAGLTKISEPFSHLLTQGMVHKDGYKMSKSRGNTVDPGPMVDKYGADTVRLFMMSDAPPDQSLDWSDAGVEGAYRFLKRLWRAVHWLKSAEVVENQHDERDAERDELYYLLHKTIAKVGDDIGRRFSFNTAIAAIRELCNAAMRFRDRYETQLGLLDRKSLEEAFRGIILMLAPIVPHTCQALWETLGENSVLMDERWPVLDQGALVQEKQEFVIQVNGKLRARLHVPVDADRDFLEKAALADDNVQRFVADSPIRKVIVVPGRLINIVV